MVAAKVESAFNLISIPDLSKEQLKMIGTLETLVKQEETVTEKHRAWIERPNAHTYRRYLVAHKWNIEKAKEGLLATLAWRDEVKPEEINSSDLFQENPWKKGSLYQRGFDKSGRPLLIFEQKFSLEEEEYEDYVKYIIYVSELQQKVANANGLYQCQVIYDLTEMTYSNNPPLSFQRRIQDTFAAHYPECTKTAFIIRQPMWFSVFFALLSPFLDDNQRAKVRLLGNDTSPLLNIFEKSQLLVKYGGEDTYEFDHENA